jgi:hypothetical protein
VLCLHFPLAPFFAPPLSLLLLFPSAPLRGRLSMHTDSKAADQIDQGA